VAIVQGSVPGKGLQFLGRARTVTRNHLQATARLAAEVDAGTLPAPAFVIWPENSTDIDPLTDTETAADIDAAVAEAGVPILVGAVFDGPGPRQVRNVGLVWNPGTGPGDFYVKRHLVPFGEYVPLRSLLTPIVPMLNEFIPLDMVAGTKSGALDIAGVRIGDMLCFDTAYDGAARADVVDGAQLLIVQTNNATYTGTGQPDQQWQITRFDALAFGRTTAVASTNGRSGVIAADGTSIATLPVIEQGYLSLSMPLRTGHTPAVWLAGWLELVLATVERTRHPGGRTAEETRVSSPDGAGVPGDGPGSAIGPVLVCIPTYNEAESLEPLVGRLRAAVPGADVLIVDDGSPDGTGAIADRLTAADPAIHVLHRPTKSGLGAAYQAAFAWGLDRDYGTLVEMDAGRLAPARAAAAAPGRARGRRSRHRVPLGSRRRCAELAGRPAADLQGRQPLHPPRPRHPAA